MPGGVMERIATFSIHEETSRAHFIPFKIAQPRSQVILAIAQFKIPYAKLRKRKWNLVRLVLAKDFMAYHPQISWHPIRLAVYTEE
jgi:hypothetical protein